MRARELPASGHALGVASRLKAAFAIRDGATAVEEAVKTFPMLQIRIFDAQTEAREEVPDSLNLVFLAFVGARAATAAPGSVNRAAGRLGHTASIPRAIMSRSPVALAFGSRRHFIPASLSLPLCGCLLNRSRDCSRSRVPPRFLASALC